MPTYQSTLRCSPRLRREDPSRRLSRRLRGEGPLPVPLKAKDRLQRRVRAKKDQAFYTSPVGVHISQAAFREWMVEWGLSNLTVVCPTAGEGALTRGFVDAHLFDRHGRPELGVRQCDYKDLDVGALGDGICIFENPPFDQHNAVPFFNHMASSPNVEAMILLFPDRFRGDQLSSRDSHGELDPYFHCVAYKPLPYGSYEAADGSRAQIQTSVQLWIRKSYPREPYSGVLVGEKRVSPAEAQFYVKRFNLDTYTLYASLITQTKPSDDKYDAWPVAFPANIDPATAMEVLQAADEKLWREYPYHSMKSIHAGNLKLHIDEVLAARGYTLAA